MRRGRRRGLLAAAVLLVAAVALAVAARSGSPTAAERAQALDAQLRCPVCQGLSVADSPSSTARAIADDVAHRVAAGESDDQIRRAYVTRYGPGILLSPSGTPGLVAVGLPVALAVLGATGLVLALRRRSPTRRADARDEELVARLRAGARAPTATEEAGAG